MRHWEKSTPDIFQKEYEESRMKSDCLNCCESYDLSEMHVRPAYETVNEEISSFPNLMKLTYTCQPIDAHSICFVARYPSNNNESKT